MQEVVLYGAGNRCKNLCEVLNQSNICVKAILDKSSEKWGEEVEGYIVDSPENILEYREIPICITIYDKDVTNKVRRYLYEEYNYKPDNEISFNELIIEAYKANSKIKEYILRYKSGQKERSVLFDCFNGLGLGGVEAWSKEMCKELIRCGKNETYIISDNGVYEVDKEIENNILYIAFENKGTYAFIPILNLIRVMMEHMPCTVITSTPNEVMLAAYLIKCHFPNEIQIISVLHAGNEYYYDTYWQFKECPNYFVAVSKDIEEEMIRRGIPREKISSMTCPFPCEKHLTRSYTEDKSKVIRIGYAGRMDGMEKSQKRMDLILKLAKILDDMSVDFRMELAGDGPVRQEMENYIRENMLEQKVAFLGQLQRNEMPKFWKQQDICINLADYEGRSISIIEAMGNGAIPIVTSTSGVKEDIISGTNGYIVPLGDYQTMAQRIIYLEKHRELISYMGKLAHEMIYPKSLMEPHIDFWKKLLSKKL